MYWQEICTDINQQTTFTFPVTAQTIKKSREVIGLNQTKEYREKGQILKIIEKAFGKGEES